MNQLVTIIMLLTSAYNVLVWLETFVSDVFTQVKVVYLLDLWLFREILDLLHKGKDLLDIVRFPRQGLLLEYVDHILDTNN